MNDHQLSVNATPQEVNDYIKLWLAAGGDIESIFTFLGKDKKNEKQFLAVFVDGDYRQVLIIKANSLEDAEQKLLDIDWDNPVRLEELDFDDDVAFIFLK